MHGELDFEQSLRERVRLLAGLQASVFDTVRAQVRLTAEPDHDADALVGRSAPMHALYKAIGRVAPTDALVLLRGESGTGRRRTITV